MALVKIGNIKGQKGDKGDKGDQGIVPPSIDKRLDVMEEIASEPGTRYENLVMDPNPASTVDTWVGGNVTLQQATTVWGRAIYTGTSGTSVVARGGFGSGEDSKAPVYPGQNVAARISIRAMDGQRMSATLYVRAFTWNGTAFVNGTTIATSGQLHIEPGAINQVTFEAFGSVPADTAFTHMEMWFTFRRYAETYPTIGDFVYFRQAALYSGPQAVAPIPYIDGNSAGAFWVDKPNKSASIRLTARTSGGGGTGSGEAKAAHAALLDDFTQRRGGTKQIGQKTSISFRIDHGLKNFDAKMRAKLESLGFPYALALGSRDWGASENAGITKTIVNNWVVGGFAEIWSHSIGHDDADTSAKIRDYIVNSRKELEADLPAAKVDGYMPPGAGGTRYMGFGPSDTPQKFYETLAGQMILQTYAVTGGSMEVYRVQDGTPRIGHGYFNMDTFDTAGVMGRVQNAINDGRGIQLMIHPSLIDTAGHITTAQLHAVLDQIKALQDAGTVIVMSAYDQLLADSTRVPGAPGPAGPGVPTGGTALQMIRKNSAGTTTEWVTPTKSIVGLNNVDNTSDLNKPVSLATRQELDTKMNVFIEDPSDPGFYFIGG
ncbi:hypothetical protein [Glutamicibacter ardleyensis]|uniref:hypothetical protein n=1 Tax=Glutamicibacter ardleyensis TaxID=225894 RepID=UPI003FD42969